MTTYKKMFGLTHKEIVQRGHEGGPFHVWNVGYTLDDGNPLLLLRADNSKVEDVEHGWEWFQDGFKAGAELEFDIECPRCKGYGDGVPEDNCPHCHQKQSCALCGGYGCVGLRKMVGRSGSILQPVNLP